MKLHNDNYLYHPILGNSLAVFAGVTLMSMSTYINGSYGWIEGHGMMFIGIFVSTFFVTWLHAYREAERFEVRLKTISHPRRFVVRGAIMLIGSVAIHFLAELSFSAWPRMITGALYMIGIFWLIFDFMLNHHRNKSWDYLSDDPNESRIDYFFYKRKALWLISKVLLFLMSLHFYHKSFLS